MIVKVITGGQTGADQGALRAAKSVGIPTGGYAPAGWETEDGSAPWLAEYGLEETNKDYAGRTRSNVRSCDVVVWFGRVDTPGFRCTSRACRDYNTPILVIGEDTTAEDMARWLKVESDGKPIVLMVAGNRESKNPGIGSETNALLSAALAILAADDRRKRGAK